MTIVVLLLVLGVLIFVHELGHFVFAKKTGMNVKSFAIGFPPTVYSFKRGGTEYKLNLIPLGGYVSIEGEDYNDDAEYSENAFVNKAWWQRLLVLFGGVLFNFLFAWLLMSVLLVVGFPRIVSDGLNPDRAAYVEGNDMGIVQVIPGELASSAGLVTGDVILEIESGGEVLEIGDEVGVDEVADFIRGGSDLRFVVERGGEVVDVFLSKEEGELIGVMLSRVGVEKLPVFKALYYGFGDTVDMVVAIVSGMGEYIKGIFDGSSSVKDISGPVGLGGFVKDAVSGGLVYVLMLTIVVSLNLAVFNLLPIPALDGGRILFVFVEALVGKRVPKRFFNYANMIGFAFLILLIIIVTVSDFVKLFG